MPRGELRILLTGGLSTLFRSSVGLCLTMFMHDVLMSSREVRFCQVLISKAYQAFGVDQIQVLVTTALF